MESREETVRGVKLDAAVGEEEAPKPELLLLL
jgi:hypothetical protein